MARFVRDAGFGDLAIVSDGAGQSRVGKTGYAALDSLLRRLLRLEDRLIRVLERPEIPLHTNASENDIRGFVTKRKISGATVSEKGRQARDVMLGLAKTCAKLKIRLFDYLGARLGIPGPQIPNLANLVREALVSIPLN
jgi:Transposase IS66 family